MVVSLQVEVVVNVSLSSANSVDNEASSLMDYHFAVSNDLVVVAIVIEVFHRLVHQPVVSMSELTHSSSRHVNVEVVVSLGRGTRELLRSSLDSHFHLNFIFNL